MIRLAAALSLAALSLAAPAAAAPQLEAFLETVRFDLASGQLLGAGQGEASLEALRLEAPVRLVAARDEVVAFQVRVRGEPGTHSATVAPVRSAAGAASGITAELFREAAVKLEAASSSPYVQSLGPGTYPDPLIPTATVAIPAAPAVAMLWVDLWVPPGTQPGVYRTALDVGGTRLPIELTVGAVQLPRADVARIGAVSFGSMKQLGEKSPEKQRDWMRLAHAHRVAIEIMYAHAPRDDRGKLDWHAWAEIYGPYVDGSAFVKGPRAGVPVTRFVLPHSDRWPTGATKRKLPTQPQRWGAALREWEQFAESRGWFSGDAPTDWILFINSLDEPKTAAAFESLARWAAVVDGAGLADRAHVKFRIDGPFLQGVEGWSDQRIIEELGPVVDIWNVCGATRWIPWHLLEKRVWDDRSERLMFYLSNTAGEPSTPPVVLDAPLTNARAWGWIIKQYNLDGALNWEIDFGTNCVENPRCADPNLNLDANLMYRGHEVGRGWYEPIASMRLKALRRGAQDVALLSLLEAEDRNTAQAILDVIVPRALGDDLPDTGRGLWPRGSDELERARLSILERLDRGLGAPPSVAAIRPEALSDPFARNASRLLIFGGVALVLAVLLTLRWRAGKVRD